MKISKYLAPLATVSLLSTMALADGMVLEPIIPSLPTTPVVSGPVDLTPSHSTNQIQILIQLDPNAVIRADRGFLKLNLMSMLHQELRRNGLNDRVENYLIQTMSLTAKSRTGEGIARLCNYYLPLTPHSQCEIINQYILSGTGYQFDDPRSWNTYPLYMSQAPLKMPVDIEVSGYVKISQIALTLEPINSGIVQPVPPIGGPFPGEVYPQIPPFLLSRNIVFNSGRYVQIGEKARLEKSVSSRNTHLTIATQNYVFAQFNWIEVTSLENVSVIDRISVNCLDDRGNNASFRATDSRGNLVENLLIRPNETLVLPVARGCTFIEMVKISGYSPNESGSRARIIVNLR